MVTTTNAAVAAASPTQTAHPARRRPPADDVPGGHLHTVDALRFLAAAGVLLYHYAGRTTQVWGADPGDVFGTFGRITTAFTLAPELFFVVSGFVVLWTAWGRTVPQVAASRLARIYPAYWAALALTSVLLLVVWPEGKRISLGEVAVNTTLMQEAFDVRNVDGAYWTLWTELRFYLLVLVLVAFGITRRRVLAFAALWPVAAVLVDQATGGFWPTLLISTHAPYFAGGMLLFLIYRDGHAPLPWALLAGNVALGLAITLEPHLGTLRAYTAFEPDARMVAAMIVGCFAAVAVAALTPLRRVSWAPLVTLGALTYPLYLVHQFWGWWVIDSLHAHLPVWLTLAAAIVVAVVLAVAVHRLVERPSNRPVRRWLERVLTRAWEGTAGRLRPRVGPRTGSRVGQA
jgi:peptidoglycan/LPS O-acetylase OafA/YrhL